MHQIFPHIFSVHPLAVPLLPPRAFHPHHRNRAYVLPAVHLQRLAFGLQLLQLVVRLRQRVMPVRVSERSNLHRQLDHLLIFQLYARNVHQQVADAPVRRG